MIRFESDYLEGAVPEILEALADSAGEQHPGYGTDERTEHARELIRQACDASNAGVYFVVGGTQINLTVIGAALKNYQGVLAPVTSHINVHEAGAIELTGHKVLILPSEDGKLQPQQIEEYCRAYQADTHGFHIVQPGIADDGNGNPLFKGRIRSHPRCLSSLRSHPFCRRGSLGVCS